MKKVEFLYDALRAPYDITLIMQIVLGMDAIMYTSGNTIDLNNKKIVNKIHSWNINDFPTVHHYLTFQDAVDDLHSKGKVLIGTSGAANDSFYDWDYSNGNTVFVFGTETTGLTLSKQKLLDGLVKLPMSSKLDFYTLPIVTSAIGFEVYRQIRRNL